MKTPAQLAHIIKTWKHVPTSVWKAWERFRHKPAPPAQAVQMFDSVTPQVIPSAAEAVAGYVDGHWPTFASLAKTHPHAHRLSITVEAAGSADCLDVEKGDATPEQAPEWLKSSRAKAAASIKPVLYTDLAGADELIRTMQAAGIPRSSYLLWTAHYTKVPHLCGPACSGAGVTFTGHADATQYDDKALGKNLDISHVRTGFFR